MFDAIVDDIRLSADYVRRLLRQIEGQGWSK